MSTLTENDDTTDELIPVETPLEETDDGDEADDGGDSSTPPAGRFGRPATFSSPSLSPSSRPAAPPPAPL